MKANSGMKLTGSIKVTIFDKNGQVKDQEQIDNLVVTAGKVWAAEMLTNVPPTAMSHLAVGSGAAAPAIGDAALGSELGRVALDSQTHSAQKVTFIATFPAGTATGAVAEAGIFNAVAAGTMLNRVTFTVKNKDATDSMVIDWDLNVN